MLGPLKHGAKERLEVSSAEIRDQERVEKTNLEWKRMDRRREGQRGDEIFLRTGSRWSLDVEPAM